MAQTSLRYQPVFLAGAWWRMDISWRTSSVDDHTFVDEWTAPGYALPVQAADEYTYMSFRNLSIKVTEDGELIAIDNIEITIGQDAVTTAFLDPDNDSAECRLWWSADNVTWYPVFWGMVDLESVIPETEAVISTTWIKRFSFVAHDCIRRLNSADFGHIGLIPDLTTYGRDVSATGTHEVFLGDRSLRTWDVAWLYPPTGLPVASVYAQAYTSLIKYIYWLIAPANICFPEHLYETPANAKYLFHATGGYSSLMVMGAFEASAAPLGSPDEAEFDEWWIPYGSVDQGEFKDEWENIGELVAEFATGIGCGVTTKHIVEVGGQWVRALWYIPRSSIAMTTVQPAGVIMKHAGPGVRFEKSKVLVSSRSPEGATPISDQKAGTGDREMKLNTHLRTVDILQHITSLTQWPERSPNRIANIFWHTIVIPSTTPGRMQVANFVRIGAVYYPAVEAAIWTNRAYNAYAAALAAYYSANVFSSGTRIEEEYSRAQCSDGTTSHPGHWVPGWKIGDLEDTGGSYRILEVDIDPENNRVKVIKEKI
jgi:hypothetical protein